jgi:hypothetical protein
MKKAFILFAAGLFCFAGTDVFAQKQNGDEMNLELQFAPLGGNPIGINGLRLRKFTSETSAFRVNLFLGGTTMREPYREVGEIEITIPGQDNPASNGSRLYDIARTFDFTIRPGYEIHFDGTDRLSPYVGVELDFGLGNVSDEQERFSPLAQRDANGNLVVQNAVQWSHIETTRYSRIGFNLVAGFDFYFVDNLYLGAELGYGWSRTNFQDSEIEWDNDAAYFYQVSFGQSIDANGPGEGQNGIYLPGAESGEAITFERSMSAFGPTVNGRIRLGYLFN